ncbi:YkgJ family cysteine cluster protein [Treponema bryantii]|uniref:YkgJ family cysteine cluster protein n=1 Tax=Treponema bryantii TaxID=163 RepID=UPI0003B60021|nr:YkgJ family cysteine cluster protein [Treponema bryantii]
MSQIAGVLEKLEGTSVYETLVQMEAAYERIACEQKQWYDAAKFYCPEGCGSCCEGFEPDLMEGEFLYMAAWLIENQNDIALQIAQNKFPFDNGKTCPLFNPASPYHCSIYNGRPFICRLFGASSFRSRNGDKTWRPCKFYPDDILAAHKPPLAKRQYSESETLQVLGAVPPLMSDFTESIAASASGETELIRDILPPTIRRLLWLINMNDNGNDNPNGSPSGAPPMAA